MDIDTSKPVKFAENTYWVGSDAEEGILRCHSYLIIDGDEAVLIDPGSPLNFDTVYQKITSLIPIKNIRYIVLSHQDPDVCSSVPLFEQNGFEGELATHWRTSVLTKYYGTKSSYYLVDQNKFQLQFSSGRVLDFIATPYLHFPGAIMVYDPLTMILFSSDLFGAFSTEREFWATQFYTESMMSFHEHYMPSNEILSPIMEMLLNLEISIIAPQHGSLINQDIREAIITLRDLECGTFLYPIKKELAQTGGYTGLCNRVLKRYRSVFQDKDILEVFEGSQIIVDTETLTISDFNLSGSDLWDAFFEAIYTRRGSSWITLVEPLVKRQANEYDVDLPKIYQAAFLDLESQINNLSAQNINLKELNDRLNNSLKNTEEKLQRCPVTSLHNEVFFNEYLRSDIQSLGSSDESVSLLVIEIDKMIETVFDYGQDAGDEVLKSTAYILEKQKSLQHRLFRLDGPKFALYLPNTMIKNGVEFADKIRTEISQSQIYLHPTTVSIGVSNINEFSELHLSPNELKESFLKIALMRLQIAKNRGMNIVCHESDIQDYSESIGKVLIIETDELNSNIIKTSLTPLKIDVVVSEDGLDAMTLIEHENPDVIISEIFLPKIDGFMLKEKMLQSSNQKDIPFIVISHKKDEESIKRATQLEILHYLKKPFMLSELVGLVTNILS
ncbi:diguanylate cyclase [bacterium]|nr:diguanylate cyclase [bacterium]